MALSSRLKLWEQKIKEEKKTLAATVLPPPPSSVPGGFLRTLVRETEKETKLKEREAKEERAPSKLSDNLVQQFLLPDQTPPILEAEMALRAEQMMNGDQRRHFPSPAEQKPPPRLVVSPSPRGQVHPLATATQNGRAGPETKDRKSPGNQQPKDKPAETGLKKDKPVETSTAKDKPVESSTAKDKPVETLTKKDKPVETLTAKDKPVETWINKDKPVLTAIKKDKPVETWIKKDNPVETLTKKDKPVETWMKKDKPVETLTKKDKPVETGIKKDKPVETLTKSEKPVETETKNERTMREKEEDETKKEMLTEARQDPEGRPADNSLGEQRKEVRDVWYEVGTVWYTHKDGFTLATQLKPDEGTPELPEGRVRVRLEKDGTLHDVAEFDIERCNPPELDLCEDLSALQMVNECGVLHTLTTRAEASLPLTQAGPNLLSLWPPAHPHSKTPRSRRGEALWEAPPAMAAQAKRVYVSMVDTRKDQSVCAMGRSGTGKTTTCQAFTHALLKQAGVAGKSISVERVQAMFAILRSFGCVSSQHSDASSRFAMVFNLDFNHAGLTAAGHLQTMMLDKWHVCQRTEGESNFLVFSQMLAGLSLEMRTELQLHQLPEANSFGMVAPTKVEEKQRASVAFTKLQAAMETLGFSANEQRAIWHVLAGIYHLGAAGACKVGRRAFVSFDSAQTASRVLGCEGEELQTAVFKHHLRQLLQRATGGSRERHAAAETEDGPRLSTSQCVEGMAAGLYEELFTAVVSLINRALSSQQLALASVTVVDAPGFRNPRHSRKERPAGWAELCHNYLQERLLEHHYTHTFTHTLERYAQEKVPVQFECPESSPARVVGSIDQPAPQVRPSDTDPRGLLWVLEEELGTPGSSENNVLERVCRYYGDTVRQCEQPLQCEVSHLLGLDPVRYDLSGWFGLVQNNPSSLNAASLLQNSSIGVVKALFGPRATVPPLCRALGGVEGGSQRSLQRSGTIRKTLSGGMASLHRHSHCIAVRLQADALLNLIRRASPTFLHCVSARREGDGGVVDVPALRLQLQCSQLLGALQLHRTGFPHQMALSDFRCRFQTLSPAVMKSYGSVFISPDERKAVEELLAALDLDRKSIVVGNSRVFMKQRTLAFLEQQRDQLVGGWLLHLQAACRGHQARIKFRKMKVQQMAVSCVQRNLRAFGAVAHWSWWELLCKLRPLLEVNMDDHRIKAKEEEISVLRRRLVKSEKERNELRQTADSLETKVTAVTSELSDERFRGDAVCQALDVERTERLRLSQENKELQARVDHCKVAVETVEKRLQQEKQRVENSQTRQAADTDTDSELSLKLECCQTEMEFLQRRLKHTEERLETERLTRQQLEAKVSSLQLQLDQAKKQVTELKRQCRRVTSDLQDARVLTDSLQSRTHELERKQRRFDSELTLALEEASSEREQKEKAVHDSTALGTQIYTMRRSLQESQEEVTRLQQQKEELCAQIRDLSLPLDLSSDSLPDLKKQIRLLESQTNERGEEITKLTAKIQKQQQVHMRFEMEMERMKQMHHKDQEDKEEELEDVHRSSQRRLRQLEMQLEQEYEEKQMVVHEKHDLEGLIATLCEQVGHRDFDVEKRLRRDLRRTHALLQDAQLLLTTMDGPGHGQNQRVTEQMERLQCQYEESEARRQEAESAQKSLSQELENGQMELENICKHKSLVDEQLAQLQHEKTELMKRLEEDQEDLNELMKKHKALIAQSSSDISQIRDLQTELEEVKKQRHQLQEELQQSATRVQYLESSTVGRSIVSKQEARVCDLENKLEFQRGQVKRFEVLVLRLRDSVVRLGEELEQSTQVEARERHHAQHAQQRLHETRLEMEELAQREQDSGRRRLELEMQVEELTAITQTLQADLETSIRRIADLQAALEEVESSDESDSESVRTAVESLGQKRDPDSVSSAGSLGAEDVGEGIRHWLGVPRGASRGSSPYGSSTISSQGGRQSAADTMSTYSFRSCVDPDEEASPTGGAGSKEGPGLGRASSSMALSELLEGLRKRRGGADPEEGSASAISLPVYRATGASSIRRRASALSLDPGDLQEPRGVLKPPSPLLQRAAGARGLGDALGSSSGSRASRCGSSPPALPHLSSLSSPPALHRCPPSLCIPEEDAPRASPLRSPLSAGRRSLLASLAGGGGEGSLGSEPLVFQNRRLAGDSGRDDSASLILPAIRRAQSTSSLGGAGRRTLSVHFGDLPPSSRGRKSSDSGGSSSSGGSSQGGSGGRRAGGPRGERLEAEGSEGGDVAAVMKKYLRKTEADS